jgi:hypothetical protein
VKRAIRLAFVVLMAIVAMQAGSGAVAAQPATAAGPICDRECLLSAMDDFVKAMTAGRPGAVPLVQHPEVRENTIVVPLGDTTWSRVKAVRSIVTIADPSTGNVVSRAGVELAAGTPGYLSTRLKVVGAGRIADVEISADTSPRVASSYVWNLDPFLAAVLPAEQRLSRVALEALARRYFHSLTTHQAVAADFDDRCNRYHSGQQITNVRSNTVEGGPPRTCAGSLEGNPPWGPATEQRFPVIDPERGLVFAVTLLHYLKTPAPSQMYVSEVFKVVEGRIVRIDNIGLMVQGVTSLGFVH